MATKETFIKDLEDILNKTNLTDEQKKKAVADANDLIPDTKVYRTIVWMLGIAVIAAVLAISTLSGLDKTLPEALTALAAAGVGALAGAITIK